MENRDPLQQTFDRLRRAPYLDAVTSYSIAMLNAPVGCSTEEQMQLGLDALEALGWTEDELADECLRREREESN